MRFGGENFAEKNRIELRNRRRSPGESLTDLHIDIRRLSALAYPDTDHKTRELISCDYFLDALADPELSFKIRQRQPIDLDSALHIALQLEVWTKDSERSSQSSVIEQTDSKKVREFTQQGKDTAAAVQMEIEEERKVIAEQSKLLKKTIESLGAVINGVHDDAPVYYGNGNRPGNKNRSGQRSRVPISCFNCSQLGHIARNCPMVVAQNKALTTDSETDGSLSDENNAATPVLSSLPQMNSPIQHVRPISEKQVKTCVKVKYRSYKLIALLDTGSDITIAGRDVADRCGWTLESRESAPIKMANGDDIVIDGVATVEIKVNGTSTEVNVFVTRDITGLILGID